MSLRVVPSGRGWSGPAVHNVCFSFRLPLYSATPAWLWRFAKLWGVVVWEWVCVHVSLEPLQTSHFFPRGKWLDIYKSPSWFGQLQWDGEKMVLWIIKVIGINNVKWCAHDWGSCFPHSTFAKVKPQGRACGSNFVTSMKVWLELNEKKWGNLALLLPCSWTNII